MGGRFTFLPAVLCALVSTACGERRTFLTIATGNTGGVYYVYGGGLANLLGRWIPGVDATAEATAASVDNMKLLDARRADLAFSLADTAFDAYKGRERFANPIDIRALAVLYSNYTHLVTLEASGIESVADFRGKRVSLGAPGSGTEVIGLRLIEAAGLTTADVIQDRLGVNESAGAIKDRKIDAFVWSGGLPTSAIQDLANSPNIRMALVPCADLLPKLVDKYGPLYSRLTIPKETYKTARDTDVIGVANLLVVRADFDEELAYRITKGMFENKDDLGAVHPEARNLRLETATIGSPIPLHPGAQRYYQESGSLRDLPR
ncbi:MAG: TAXI family TRAP transporter solute-binding subunit [Acidobacteria bacterium]|nr:TAXI family TRAP transporter solute-binding subunit [Acidobacteriota bacterium]